MRREERNERHEDDARRRHAAERVGERIDAAPYDTEPARPASNATTAPLSTIIGSKLASTVTPPMPSSNPSTMRGGGSERARSAVIAAAKIGAVALRIESSDADSLCAANAKSRNGSAELHVPRIR